MVTANNVTISAKTQLWCVVVVIVVVTVMEVASLNGPNVCMVKQKYNITKRVKYRAPMSVRTYEWCFSMPPRCSKWNTEMRDLTRLEAEERTAEVAVCCPGYKMRDVSCVPICPHGKTGHGCSEGCPPNKWGPNCVNDCPYCSDRGACSSITGECVCQEGWQGESCESRMSSTTSTMSPTTIRVEELLTSATKPTLPIAIASTVSSTRTTLLETTISSTSRSTTKRIRLPMLETTPSKTPFQQNTSSLKTTFENSIEEVSPTTVLTTASTPASNIRTPTTIVLIRTIPPLDVLSTILPVTMPETSTTTSVLTTTMKPSTAEVTIASPIIEKSNNSEGNNNQTTAATTKVDVVTTLTSNEIPKSTTESNNVTLTTVRLREDLKPATEVIETVLLTNSIFNRTSPPTETKKTIKEVSAEIKRTPSVVKINEITTPTPQKTTAVSIFTEAAITTTPYLTTSTEGTTKAEIARRPDATIRYFPTTINFKPKEIWIRPAQKGESFIETKKATHDLHRHRAATNKDPAPTTTPKTIIVSIIPTSVSYATFKKIAFTTVTLLPQKTSATLNSYNKSIEQGFTEPMAMLTTTESPLISKLSSTAKLFFQTTTNISILKNANSSKSNSHFHKVAKTISSFNTRMPIMNNNVSLNGSMTTVNQNLNSSNFITPTDYSTNFTQTTHKATTTLEKSTKLIVTKYVDKVTKHSFIKVTSKPTNVTNRTVFEKIETVKIAKPVDKDVEKTNATKIKTNKVTTESPDEETFHILTEPEHITAVMEGKGKEASSVDLISVISIAGGIMIAMITVAVIIVMIERCRRPGYEDVRKVNDIRMQDMIDNNDVPPPYVRSIFHTPLPDPPASEKCHYQPISTLDRNLKQFMRPVVVQTISPIMLENFREILECHYDHLPRRSQDFDARAKHFPIPPSMEDVEELARLRPCSIAESTIEALKCEAKFDVIDSTTSEPLYAEIPCWRPPSEHAIEIMNLNGEAVTEL